MTIRDWEGQGKEMKDTFLTGVKNSHMEELSLDVLLHKVDEGARFITTHITRSQQTNTLNECGVGKRK